MSKDQTKFRGYLVAFCTLIIGVLSTGMAGIYGMMIPSISEGLNIPYETLYYIFTISCVVSFVTNFLLAGVIKKIGIRWALAIGVICRAIDFLIMANATKFWHIICAAIFGSTCGSFAGFATLAIVVDRWFIKDRAKWQGIVMGAAVFGTPLFTFIGGQIIYHMNYHVAYYLMLAVDIILGILCLIFIVDPEKIGQKPLGWEERAQLEAAAADSAANAKTGPTMKQLFKSPALYVLLLACMVFTMTVESFGSYGASYFATRGLNELQYSSILTIGMLVFAVVTLFSGGLSQKLGSKKVLILCAVCGAVGSILFYIWGDHPSMGLLTAAALIIAVSCPLEVNFSTFTGYDVLGGRAFDNYSPLFTAALYGGVALTPFILNVIAAKYGDIKQFYLFCCIGSLVFLVLSLLCYVISPMKKQKDVEEKTDTE